MTTTNDLLEITISNDKAGDCPVGKAIYKGTEYLLTSPLTLSDALLPPDITCHTYHRGLFDYGNTKFHKKCNATNTDESVEVDFGRIRINTATILSGLVPNPVEELLQRKAMVLKAFEELHPKINLSFTQAESPVTKSTITTHTFQRNTYGLEVTLDSSKLIDQITRVRIYDLITYTTLNEWVTHLQIVNNSDTIKRLLIQYMTGFRCADRTSYTDGFFSRGSYLYREVKTSEFNECPLEFLYQRNTGKERWNITTLTVRNVYDYFDELHSYFEDFDKKVKQERRQTDDYFLVKDGISVSLIWNNEGNFVQDIRVDGSTCPMSRADGTNARMKWLLTEMLELKTPLRVKVLEYKPSVISVEIAHDVTFEIMPPSIELAKLHELRKEDLRIFLKDLFSLVNSLTSKLNLASKKVSQPFN